MRGFFLCAEASLLQLGGKNISPSYTPSEKIVRLLKPILRQEKLFGTAVLRTSASLLPAVKIAPPYIYPMFENLPDISRYALFPDEAYTSDALFENTVGFLKYMANDSEGELSIGDDILVFELKEGVFIRAKSTKWCEVLTGLVNQPVVDYPTLKLFPVKKLDDLARNYRQPIEAFGEYRLVRWKVGF
jgi:hypothetical protein